VNRPAFVRNEHGAIQRSFHATADAVAPLLADRKRLASDLRDDHALYP
jgi:hypothetical protein